MIPSLRNVNRRDPLYSAYVEALRNSAFTGDIEDAYASRLLVATDNSVYQALPQAVIFPKNEADMVIAVRLWHEERFKKLIFTPRGGGTGTNGQSLNHGLVMDTSRYMKGVGEIHKEAREVTVQAGVIKDELNEKLLPLGLFFSPELSTSSRATIGGMVSNEELGVRAWLSGLMNTVFGNMPFPAFVVLLVLLTLICTNFFSNTATAVIIEIKSGRSSLN